MVNWVLGAVGQEKVEDRKNTVGSKDKAAGPVSPSFSPSCRRKVRARETHL